MLSKKKALEGQESPRSEALPSEPQPNASGKVDRRGRGWRGQFDPRGQGAPVQLPGFHARRAQAGPARRGPRGRGGTQASRSVASRCECRRAEGYAQRRRRVKALGRPTGLRQCPRSRAATHSQPAKTGQRAGMPTAAVADWGPSRARFLQECLASTRAHSFV